MKTVPACIILCILSPVAAMAASPRENWDNHCAKCHGENGDGRTKTGTQRWIKDYTDPKVQAEFSDSGLLKNLLLGIRSDDGKERMPAFKDKLPVNEAKDLIALIRSFRR